VVEFLDNPKVRIGIFALVVAVLLGLVVWASSTLGQGDPQNVASSAAPSAAPIIESVEPGLEGIVVEDTVEAPEAPEPGDLPAPDPLPDSDVPPSPPTVGERDVIRFLKFSNTYSAKDIFDDRSKEAVRLGAVPSSPATLIPLSPKEQQDCKAVSCSSEFINATNVSVTDSGTAAALVEVKMTSNGSSYNIFLMCTLMLATGNEPNPGLFTDVTCYYGGGD